MKLLLTSAGFLNKEVSDTFLSLLNKPVGQIHIIFIPTASRTEHELKYVEESRQELVDLGITKITTLNLDRKVMVEEINSADVIYVCGGNTFRLLKYAREAHFKETIEKLLDRGGVYIGVSAGSIILAPTIQIAASVDPEPNEIGISDLTGLNLIDFEIHPHYEPIQDAELSFYQKVTKNKVIGISNSQALIISNSGQEVVE